MRYIKTLFLTCFLSLALNATEEETYVIEAKGEFAKELKELVEKHSQIEGVEINVYERDASGSAMNNYQERRTLEYAKERGEKLYLNNCLECHGEKGTKRSYATAKKLSNMRADDIYMSFRKYVSDGQHGGSSRVTMIPIAGRINDTELGYIIAYLKDDTSFVWKTSTPKENTNISRNPTGQGSYLK
ncbi:MAG: cytochrome c [Campylobacter sp.]|nr:cytochrome c [Campylobacter sp.]